MDTNHNFLRSLAQRCFETFGDKCDQLSIIFPNKRAGIYFARHLSELFDQPVWSPNIYSFEEFVIGNQEQLLADELQLNLILYDVYKDLIKEPESFDAFLPWGEMILKDFNDIDNYLVDPSHIFKVVKSQKELEESFQFLSERDQKVIQQFWSSFLPSPTKKQDEFIQTWSILQELYEVFNQRLEEKQLTYKGRLFRKFAQEVTSPTDVFWFAGFNALTGAEEEIIKTYLSTEGNGIFWDVDEYYFRDINQESGVFFRAYAEDRIFAPSIKRDLSSNFQNQDKPIEINSAPFAMGQIMMASQVLEDKLNSGTKPEDILIILTDESMLDPLIKSLPASLEDINVTMGWPLAKSRSYLMLTRLIALIERQNEKGFSNFHRREIEPFFEFQNLLDIKADAYQQFKAEGIESNKLYFSVNDVLAFFPIFKTLLVREASLENHLNRILAFIKNLETGEWSDLEQSVVALVHQKIKQVLHAIEGSQVILELKSFLKLFKKLGQSVKIPLSGDPASGVQIMGILETRNLTFEHVMIIGMNEGAWPKDSSNASFIPYNIRLAFELPVTAQQDAMQSYLFYRLVQSAQHLWVSYNNISEFNHNGELSRYAQQLKHESGLKIIERSIVSTIEGEADHAIVIKKEGETLERLKRYLVGKSTPQKRLSPSALNTYLDCKLRFYFRYVKNLYEPEEVIEDLDPSLLGNLLHGGMEHLYANKSVLDAEALSKMKVHLEAAVNASFEEQKLSMDDDASAIGRQLIAYEVVKKYMEAILDFDIQNSPFTILGLEEEYFAELSIETPDATEKVALKGIIDRIDQLGEVIRIVDYKSGRDERSFKDVDSLVDNELEKRDKAIFQLFYYCMLYKANHPENGRPLQPGMFNSKDLFDKNFDLLVYQNGRPKTAVLDYAVHEEDFMSALNYLLTNIFNPSVDFTQTEDVKKCQYCPYQQICMRG